MRTKPQAAIQAAGLFGCDPCDRSGKSPAMHLGHNKITPILSARPVCDKTQALSVLGGLWGKCCS